MESKINEILTPIFKDKKNYFTEKLSDELVNNYTRYISTVVNYVIDRLTYMLKKPELFNAATDTKKMELFNTIKYFYIKFMEYVKKRYGDKLLTELKANEDIKNTINQFNAILTDEKHKQYVKDNLSDISKKTTEASLNKIKSKIELYKMSSFSKTKYKINDEIIEKYITQKKEEKKETKEETKKEPKKEEKKEPKKETKKEPKKKEKKEEKIEHEITDVITLDEDIVPIAPSDTITPIKPPEIPVMPEDEAEKIETTTPSETMTEEDKEYTDIMMPPLTEEKGKIEKEKYIAPIEIKESISETVSKFHTKWDVLKEQYFNKKFIESGTGYNSLFYPYKISNSESDRYVQGGIRNLRDFKAYLNSIKYTGKPISTYKKLIEEFNPNNDFNNRYVGIIPPDFMKNYVELVRNVDSKKGSKILSDLTDITTGFKVFYHILFPDDIIKKLTDETEYILFKNALNSYNLFQAISVIFKAQEDNPILIKTDTIKNAIKKITSGTSNISNIPVKVDDAQRQIAAMKIAEENIKNKKLQNSIINLMEMDKNTVPLKMPSGGDFIEDVSSLIIKSIPVNINDEKRLKLYKNIYDIINSNIKLYQKQYTRGGNVYGSSFLNPYGSGKSGTQSGNLEQKINPLNKFVQNIVMNLYYFSEFPTIKTLTVIFKTLKAAIIAFFMKNNDEISKIKSYSKFNEYIKNNLKNIMKMGIDYMIKMLNKGHPFSGKIDTVSTELLKKMDSLLTKFLKVINITAKNYFK